MVNPPYSISLIASRVAHATIGCMRIVSWITCHVYFIFHVSSQHSKSPTFSIAIFFCSITCTNVNLQFQLNGISWQGEKDKFVLKWHRMPIYVKCDSIQNLHFSRPFHQSYDLGNIPLITSCKQCGFKNKYLSTTAIVPHVVSWPANRNVKMLSLISSLVTRWP